MSSELEEIRQKKMVELMEKVKEDRTEGNGSPEAPVVVTDSSFDEFVKKYPKVVVDCWAPWCGPCRMLSPTVEAMAKDYKGTVVFGKINTDDNFRVSSKYRIMSIPTLLFFKDGKFVDQMIGAAPRAMIDKQIRKALG